MTNDCESSCCIVMVTVLTVEEKMWGWVGMRKPKTVIINVWYCWEHYALIVIIVWPSIIDMVNDETVLLLLLLVLLLTGSIVMVVFIYSLIENLLLLIWRYCCMCVWSIHCWCTLMMTYVSDVFPEHGIMYWWYYDAEQVCVWYMCDVETWWVLLGSVIDDGILLKCGMLMTSLLWKYD